MSFNDYNGIWVFAEQRDNELHEVSLELLGKARELADQSAMRVTAILVGHHIKSLAQVLINHGAHSVLIADDPRLESYRLIPYSLVMEQLIREYEPDILLMGATAMGVELAPRVAAKVQTGLSAHCIDLRLDDGQLLQVVPGWGGGVIATITCPDHRPQIATVMPGIMPVRKPVEGSGAVLDVAVKLPDNNLGPEVLEVTMEKPKEPPLEKADVVVAGGWGIGGEENWHMIEELASLLGGAVGATRPPVDEGWAREGQMIGQSGKTVRPTLYIGIGISGVMHHVVGMDQSKYTININTDPEADIFKVSDVIIVDDFKKILPPLIREIRSRLKEQ